VPLIVPETDELALAPKDRAVGPGAAFLFRRLLSRTWYARHTSPGQPPKDNRLLTAAGQQFLPSEGFFMFAAIFAVLAFATVGSAIVYVVRRLEESERILQQQLGILVR
jgi:hypothetical protein